MTTEKTGPSPALMAIKQSFLADINARKSSPAAAQPTTTAQSTATPVEERGFFANALAKKFEAANRSQSLSQSESDSDCSSQRDSDSYFFDDNELGMG